MHIIIVLAFIIAYTAVSVIMMHEYVKSNSTLVNHCDPSTELIMIAFFPGTMFWVGIFALQEVIKLYHRKTSITSPNRIHN